MPKSDWGMNRPRPICPKAVASRKHPSLNKREPITKAAIRAHTNTTLASPRPSSTDKSTKSVGSEQKCTSCVSFHHSLRKDTDAATNPPRSTSISPPDAPSGRGAELTIFACIWLGAVMGWGLRYKQCKMKRLVLVWVAFCLVSVICFDWLD